MTDVKDILGGSVPPATSASLSRFVSTSSSSSSSPRPVVSSSSSLPSSSGAAASGHKAGHKATNVPRELQQLKSEVNWGQNQVLQPLNTTNIFKAKRVKAVSWKNLPIHSSARQSQTGKSVDDLVLHHWVKIHHVPDYRFARFNKPIKFLSYTDDEYQLYLQDASWSRAETEQLYRLCKQHDLRFIVIEDRYNIWAEQQRQVTLAQMAANPSSSSSDALNASSDLSLSSATMMLDAPSDAAAAAAATQHNNSDHYVLVKQEHTENYADNNTANTTNASSSLSSSSFSSSTAAASSSSSSDSAVSTSLSDEQPPPLEQPNSSSSSSSLTTSSSTAAATATATTSSPPSPPSAPTVTPIERTIEALKARFYHTQQLLLSVRNASDPDLKAHPLFSCAFNPAHEVERKRQLEILLQRKQADVDNMAVLVLEHRKVDNMIKKLKKTASSQRAALRAPKAGNVKKSKFNAPVGELAPIPDSCVVTQLTQQPTSGCYLRSAQLAAPLILPLKQQKLLESESTTYNLRKVRENMVPTGVVCELYDRVRCNILTLANLTSYVQQKEAMLFDLKKATQHQVRAAEAQREAANTTSSSTSSTSTSHKKKSEKRPADAVSSSSSNNNSSDPNKRPRKK